MLEKPELNERPVKYFALSLLHLILEKVENGFIFFSTIAMEGLKEFHQKRREKILCVF